MNIFPESVILTYAFCNLQYSFNSYFIPSKIASIFSSVKFSK
jgi:hypothetical protein